MNPVTHDIPQKDRTSLHYETLLAPIYRWMLGDFPSAVQRSNAELRALGVRAARPGARALDLGAGLGLQSIPLAELGYEVTALDSSETLLSELSEACPQVHTVQADLAQLGKFLVAEYEVIVCTGDTLTHLRSEQEVRTLFSAAREHLSPGGLLLLTFRDYTGPPRQSTNRFLLVRGDSERILTCCLEYTDDRVLVTDIVHEQSSSGWVLRASEYVKLRLSSSFVTEELIAQGLTVERCESSGGCISIVARRGQG